MNVVMNDHFGFSSVEEEIFDSKSEFFSLREGLVFPSRFRVRKIEGKKQKQ
jgi:hypothetical protein